jgi:alpha-ketoglutarate-dependent taurine dioxygenase
MTFEHVPSDYAVLKMRVCPKMGGDTLWASAYEVYDRISKPIQKLLDGLTCLHANPDFIQASQRNGFAIHPGPRGAAENVGTDLLANHPVIRTNPVTGWRSVYGALNQIQQINEVTVQESDWILEYLHKIVIENHDLQVRYHWGVDDVAIVSHSTYRHFNTY